MNHVRGLTAPAWLVFAAIVAWLPGCVANHGHTGDRELRAATTAAQLAFGEGRLGLSAQMYDRALLRARAMDDSPAIADAAYNLAACLTEMGEYQQADTKLDDALAEAKRAGSRVIDVLLLKATVARLGKKPSEVFAAAEQVLSHRPPPTGTERSQAYLIEAEAACDAGDSHAAARYMAQVNVAVLSSPTLQARLAEARGRIASLNKDWRGAATEFDRAAELWRGAHRYSSMSRDLGHAADAYAAAGLSGLAADRYYRAARSAFGLGDAVASMKHIAAARAAAKAAGAADLEARADALAGEIKAAAGKK
ncbi:MAG TPA: hypothetical protein VN541_02370 [Tepidisphaeraceae bacterium]|nr:hypothetical protein [Tepidisphaeraceae bacterium]